MSRKTAPSYWHTLLDGLSSSTKIWLDGFGHSQTHSQTSSQTSTRGTHGYLKKTFSLDAKTKKALLTFAKKNQLSPEILLQGTWGLLLNRYAGADDTSYGIFTKKSKKIFPLRSTIHPKLTLLAYLKALQKQLDKSIKEASQFDAAVFKDTFEYIFLPSGNIKPRDIKAEAHALLFQVVKLPSLQFAFYYDKVKFSTESISQLVTHFKLILDTVLTSPRQFTTHFSILTDEEKQKILLDWSAPKDPLPLELKKHCPHDLFSEWSDKHPENIAIHYNSQKLTYSELEKHSNQLANLLHNNKVQAGDTVAVFMDRTPAIIIAMLGVLKTGAIYVPLNLNYPDERIDFILNDCKAKIILVNNTSRIPKTLHNRCLTLNDSLIELNGLSSKKITVKIKPEKPAYIIYTSGTTGKPKGVIINHISLVNLTHWYRKHFNITQFDRASQFASQGFDPFFCETLPFLATGASVYIINDHDKLSPGIFLPWLKEHKITVCDLPVAYALMLFTLPWPEQLNLRIVKIGGESVTHYPTQTFPFEIWNGYGPTEATIESTFMKIYEANTPSEKQPLQHAPPPIGKPISNFEAYILDHHSQPVPIGVAGELMIGGIGLSRGYLGRTKLTREKFIRNPFSNNPKSKLYRTGDFARWLPDGNLEFNGRRDDQIKIRGFRIELSEIQTHLSQFSDVNEVVVLAKESIAHQKSLVSYLVPDLDKLRIPYQERCMISIEDLRFMDVFTEDYSKEGIAITGLSEKLPLNQQLKLRVRLPGITDDKWLNGHLVWQDGLRAGIQFDDLPEQNIILNQSVDFYLAHHNLMEVLKSAYTRRNLRKALAKKLPDYMVPSVFTILSHFPLTFNGKIDLKALPATQDYERMLERKFVSPRTKTEEALTDIWRELLKHDQISMTDNFFDMGGNSILVSQLSVKAMQKFQISIPTKILFDLPFIPVQAEYIDSKGKKYTENTSIQDDISRDCLLHEDIAPSKQLAASLFNRPKGILLTGASGFLGIYLLRELLKKTDAKIFCLVRKGQFETPAKRLTSTIQNFSLENEMSLANRRIVIVDSDIALDGFGISQDQYNHLAEQTDIIYHCGAQVNTMAAYTALRGSNVQGTIEVIKFSTHKKDKPIHYISTLSAAYLKNTAGDFSEEFPDNTSHDLVGGYAISKWVSEKLLSQIQKRGLPVCIYRSGYILGQSDTGLCNLNDSLLFLLKGCIQLGMAPDWKEKIAILPVDFVSQAIVDISLHQPEKSGVFHLDHPAGIPWTDLIPWLNRYGYNIKMCSHRKWIQLLTEIPTDNALFPFLPHYLSLKNAPETPGTEVTRAREALKNVKMDFPVVDDALLKRYMDYLCGVGFLPKVG